MATDPVTEETLGEGMAFFHWVIGWGFVYKTELTNQSALWSWRQRSYR